MLTTWRDGLANINQRNVKMTEIVYNKSHHAGGTAEARIANRQRSSSADEAKRLQDSAGEKATTQHRTVTTVHHSGAQHKGEWTQ